VATVVTAVKTHDPVFSLLAPIAIAVEHGPVSLQLAPIAAVETHGHASLLLLLFLSTHSNHSQPVSKP